MKKILMAAVEAKPYATAGGTSAVVGTLSNVLHRRGYDVRLVLPYYSSLIRVPDYQIEYVTRLDVPVGREPIPPIPEDWPESLRSYLQRRTEPPPQAFVYQAHPANNDSSPEGVPVYFVGGDPFHYFARANGKEVPLYPPLEEISVDAGRLYAFFCRAVIEIIAEFIQQGWRPDIVHCHDWPAGLIPAYLKCAQECAIPIQDVKTVMTIHNSSDIVYQGGWFDPEILHYAGLTQSMFDYGQVQHQSSVNFMKTGIVFADAVNTVSEGYAAEIMQSAEESYLDINGRRRTYCYSGGLDYVWSQYQIDLIGIRNGIDYGYAPNTIGQGEDWALVDQDWRANFAPAEGRSVAEWAYVATDPQLWDKKRALKRYLQERCNRFLRTDLEISEEIPVIAVRSRLVEQKGFDLILRGLQEWDFEHPVQFIIIAWGEDLYAVQYRQQIEDLSKQYPKQIAFSRSWRDIPETLHYAGADMLLMPSLFEPCGLPHMMALRYGTIPIVRRTGGLADVVQEFNPIAGTGNGFDFIAPDHREMLRAIQRAIQVYCSPEHWQSLVHNAIQARDRRGDDFSWETAVNRYVDMLYS
jgi:starch synthase